MANKKAKPRRLAPPSCLPNKRPIKRPVKRPPNQPTTARWKVICARTRATRIELDAAIGDERPEPGPVMVFRGPRRPETTKPLESVDFERPEHDGDLPS